MGAQKLLMPFRGRPMIDCVIEAAREWEPLVIAGDEVAKHLHEAGVAVVFNDAPQRGMSHSLVLADAAISRDSALIVLLGDMPLVSPELIRLVCNHLGSTDVAFPVHARTGAPGHPVVLSVRARERIPDLADGDTIRTLRDDPRLSRVTIPTEDAGAFFDVDTPEALER